jgi:hypothetical protein
MRLFHVSMRRFVFVLRQFFVVMRLKNYTMRLFHSAVTMRSLNYKPTKNSATGDRVSDESGISF